MVQAESICHHFQVNIAYPKKWIANLMRQYKTRIKMDTKYEEDKSKNGRGTNVSLLAISSGFEESEKQKQKSEWVVSSLEWFFNFGCFSVF
ncbi:hypothetical protein SDJN02_10699, partial [Cucurbita argyrosperma subsp. argyrosperma]